MRVKYGTLRGPERRKLAELDVRIDKLFEEAQRTGRDSAWWRSAAREVHPGLSAERWHDGRVIVRADERAQNPIAERVASKAPAALSVDSRRPARELARVLRDLQAEDGVDLARARFRAGFGRGHLLEVVLYLPGGSGSEREHAAAERLVWEVLGERAADDWIGAVSVSPEPRGRPLHVLAEPRARGQKAEAPRLSLDALPSTVDAAVQGLREAFPEAPAWARPDPRDWVLLELEPEAAEDWQEQDDLLISSTCEPELLKSFLSGAPFSSVRFSRHQESYWYLKFVAEGDPELRLSRRSALEDLLDSALVEARLGRVVGGGLGVRYSYVDLALGDCAPSFEVIRRVAQAAELPRASWVLAFDDDLSAEWIEIWPDATPPPGYST